ncbi:hypothetical protein O6H91_04G057600 [Diphasiastrum complanatum]|uniref:Uncharacterized protein n=1 Tax=Diphasiastrum complanatum TaxID=34168 RepID=A0ACC2DX61_DIPCM|nr:hypothetical protein O6H91_04G057600 [Diphasiastrum complanatum]
MIDCSFIVRACVSLLNAFDYTILTAKGHSSHVRSNGTIFLMLVYLWSQPLHLTYSFASFCRVVYYLDQFVPKKINLTLVIQICGLDEQRESFNQTVESELN